MNDNDDNDNPIDEDSKQPFVSQADRPEVRLKSDTPLSELTVRDLASLLAQVGPTHKDFWDGKDWIKDDAEGGIKTKDLKEKDKEKEKEKEKVEKWEKSEKHEKFEKFEKPEKPENKESKAEKNENDGVFDPGIVRALDSRLEQVIQALSGLTARVTELANPNEERKEAGEG